MAELLTLLGVRTTHPPARAPARSAPQQQRPVFPAHGAVPGSGAPPGSSKALATTAREDTVPEYVPGWTPHPSAPPGEEVSDAYAITPGADEGEEGAEEGEKRAPPKRNSSAPSTPNMDRLQRAWLVLTEGFTLADAMPSCRQQIEAVVGIRSHDAHQAKGVVKSKAPAPPASSGQTDAGRTDKMLQACVQSLFTPEHFLSDAMRTKLMGIATVATKKDKWPLGHHLIQGGQINKAALRFTDEESDALAKFMPLLCMVITDARVLVERREAQRTTPAQDIFAAVDQAWHEVITLMEEVRNIIVFAKTQRELKLPKNFTTMHDMTKDMHDASFKKEQELLQEDNHINSLRGQVLTFNEQIHDINRSASDVRVELARAEDRRRMLNRELLSLTDPQHLASETLQHIATVTHDDALLSVRDPQLKHPDDMMDRLSALFGLTEGSE